MFARTALTLALTAALAAAAAAQPPAGPGLPQRPTVSPYLNLLRGGNQGINYYGLVRPQQQFYQGQAQLQQQLNATNQDLAQTQQLGPYTGLGGGLVTGTAAGFQTHRQYFLTAGTGVGGSFGLTGANVYGRGPAGLPSTGAAFGTVNRGGAAVNAGPALRR